MLIIIDNYDSFTYNLVQYFKQLGVQDVNVFRNDEVTLTAIEALNPTHIVISPGPCTPNEAGISLHVIKHFASKIPILGVCLGHQAIGQFFSGKVIRAEKVMHGKTSLINHTASGVFKNIPPLIKVTRYHSLIVDWKTLPDCLEVTAWTESQFGEKQEIMGLRHRKCLIEGVQFHPESILTESGLTLLNNFIAY